MMLWLILGAVWAAVLLPPLMRNRRDGRPSSSVVSFRAQLSTLERATPGSSMRLDSSGAVAVGHSRRIDAKRRRLEVLVTLLGATALTLVLALALGGIAVALFVVTAGACGAYIYALRQIHLRQMERQEKVRPLVPRTMAMAPMTSMTVRRTAAN